MRSQYAKIGLVAAAMTLGITACGDDVLYSQEGGQFSTVNSISDEKCNDENEGSMAFVKSKATMYVCSEGEWVAMKDEEAIQYRCESKELKDKSGFAIVCDGDTIGVVKNGKDGADGKDGSNGKDGTDGKNGTNGTNGKDGKNGTNGTDGTNGTNGSNGTNGVSADTAAITKAIKDALSSASAKNKSEIEEALKNLSSASAKNKSEIDDALKNLSSASAKNQKDVDEAISNLSSASSKNQKDVDDALKNLSSATDKYGKDINDKFDDAYSSLSAELEDKKCEIVNTERNDETAIITVFIKCGEAETKMEIPFTVPNENLEKKFTKHVVVRLPVMSEKKTGSDDIYEELWSHLKSGKYSELSIIDLDKKYDATGKMFVTDLVASASQPFVTVEEVNQREVKYNVVRLEGDIDVTNLTNPIVELRVKMNLGGLNFSTVDFVYNTIVDLTDKDPNVLDATDTVVIDFLTDYKTARVKYLLSNGRDFDNALLQANDELAKALYLKKDGEDYPQFEHYVPNKVDLYEYFNGVFWIMALVDQADVAKNVNKAYNDFRTIFAEEGNFKKPAKTQFDGRELSMYFVDYLALLINANFDRYNYCEGTMCFDYIYEDYNSDRDDEYYKILQKGFKEVYRLDVEMTRDFGNGYKVQKTSVEDGYFTYFKYDAVQNIWSPIVSDDVSFIQTVAITIEDGECTVARKGELITMTSEKLDFSLQCSCWNDQCYWGMWDPCRGRDVGYHGFTRQRGSAPQEIYEFECVENPSCDDSDQDCYPWEREINTSSSSSYKSDEEILIDAIGIDCSEEVMKNDEKNFVKLNLKELMLSTTIGYGYFKCDHVFNDDGVDFYKWVSASDMDVEFNQACVESHKNEVRKVGETHYVCREYTPSSSTSSHSWSEEYDSEFFKEQRCTQEKSGEILSLEKEDGSVVYKTCNQDEYNNFKWMDTEPGDYCKDNVKVNGETKNNITATTQIEPNEELPEDKIFDQKCNFNGTFYVHSTSKAAWMNVNQYCEYVYRDPTYEYDNTWRIGKNYRIFMEGYTDRKLYLCDVARRGDNNCEETTEEVVRGLNIVNSLGVVLYATETTAQNQLNLLANMTEYKKASEDLFITEVLLPGETEKTTLAASAKRLDWHEATLDEQCSGHSVRLHSKYDPATGEPLSSGSTATEDRICTLDDGTRYFKGASGIDGYWDDTIGEANFYSDKWYSVKEYCHTKNRDCYTASESAANQSASSSATCEFPEYHEEKIVYACDGSTGEWVEWQKFCDANKKEVTYDSESGKFNIEYLTKSWTNLSCSHDSNDDPANVEFYCDAGGYYKLKNSDIWKSITCLTR